MSFVLAVLAVIGLAEISSGGGGGIGGGGGFVSERPFLSSEGGGPGFISMSQGSYIGTSGEMLILSKPDLAIVQAANQAQASAPVGSIVTTSQGITGLNVGTSQEVGVGVYQAQIPQWLPGTGLGFSTFATLGITSAAGVLAYEQAELARAENRPTPNADLVSGLQTDIEFLQRYV